MAREIQVINGEFPAVNRASQEQFNRSVAKLLNASARGGGGLSGPPTGSAGGDLNGSYPNPTLGIVTSYTRTLLDDASAAVARVTLGSLSGEVANVKVDYGADSTGVADATADIQSALDAFSAGTARGVYLPASFYKVTPGGLTLGLATGGRIVGDAGLHGDLNFTVFRGTFIGSDGTNPTEALLTVDSGGLLIADLNFWGNNSASLTGACCGLRWQNRVGDGIGAGTSTFERLTFQWCDAGFDVGFWLGAGPDPDHDDQNCDTYLLNQCLFVNCNSAIRLHQDQNVQFVLNQPVMFGCDVGIEALKGGVVEISGLSAYNLGVVIKVTDGGDRVNFKVDQGGMDNDGTMRPRLFEAVGACECQAVFDTVGFTPAYLANGGLTGQPCIDVYAGNEVEVRRGRNMGNLANPIVKFHGGGHVLLFGCRIPSNHSAVRDPTGTGGTLLVINCVDEATGAKIPDWGDLDSVNADTATVADAGGDTTCWVVLAGSATGDLPLLSDAGLTYNATANALTATTFVGALSGNASTATALQTARSIYGSNFDGTAALAGPIAGTYGGTGVNNGASTITIGGSVTFSGAFTTTLTVTANTSVTLPTSGTLTRTADKLSVFAATSSAELAGVISDETGTGALVFANTPTLVTPILGTPTSGVLTNCTGLPIGGGGTGTTTGAADGYTTLVESADRTSTGAMTNATDMVFAVTAGHFYIVEGLCSLDSVNQTNDGAIQMFVDAGTMLGEGQAHAQGASLTAQNVAITANAVQFSNVIAVGSRASGTPTSIMYHYAFVPSQTTNFRIRFGNNTNNTTNTVLKKKSRMRIVDCT